VLNVKGGTAMHISDSWNGIEKIVQFQEKLPDSPN
jgi:hypothetical protein